MLPRMGAQGTFGQVLDRGKTLGHCISSGDLFFVALVFD
ncbi:hypothetical protein SAMN05443432_102299 [Roseovarius litoreus]|uniref:Uncharacterized protein n=1 Tax=Roseovarius litoreus TaxID=1155722 RepID=A0A1M7CU39_9RHOB|nr:hypothetical protein SAMN05443432_102299 [Roseovarius litoreus]